MINCFLHRLLVNTFFGFQNRMMNTGPLFDKIDFRKIVGYYDERYPSLDPTTSHYEFLSYIESCQSLNVKPSITRFVKYNRYFNQHGK